MHLTSSAVMKFFIPLVQCSLLVIFVHSPAEKILVSQFVAQTITISGIKVICLPASTGSHQPAAFSKRGRIHPHASSSLINHHKQQKVLCLQPTCLLLSPKSKARSVIRANVLLRKTKSDCELKKELSHLIIYYTF